MACLQLLIRNHGLIGPECDIHCPSLRCSGGRCQGFILQERNFSVCFCAGGPLMPLTSSHLCLRETALIVVLHVKLRFQVSFERCTCMWELSIRPPRAGEGCRGWQGALVGEVKWVENQKEEWGPWGQMHTCNGAKTTPCQSLLSWVC